MGKEILKGDDGQLDQYVLLSQNLIITQRYYSERVDATFGARMREHKRPETKVRYLLFATYSIGAFKLPGRDMSVLGGN
jgi:hypothetical protein